MKKYNYNFSIITTGGCSSSCSFCTDPFNVKPSPNYLRNLSEAIFSKEKLPAIFNQVSVTGGEPTQSPDFQQVCLFLLSDKMREHPQFEKRVLTTNGWKLGKYIDLVGDTFNHVNISRHGIGDEANFKVFGGKNIATDEEIKGYCSALAKRGVDVNLNHVYSTNLGVEYVKEYVQYAKSLNATKVTFRFDQNTNQIEMSELEQEVVEEYTQVESGGCPVCREACYLIDGMYVTFKNSCAEPTHELGGELYEIIYHTDGNLYKDWSQKYPYPSKGTEMAKIYITQQTAKLNQELYKEYTRQISRGSGGCGSGGCGR